MKPDYDRIAELERDLGFPPSTRPPRAVMHELDEAVAAALGFLFLGRDTAGVYGSRWAQGSRRGPCWR